MKVPNFVRDFDAAVARYGRERNVRGVICGHIHAAAMRDVDGIRYINCGDWVDSCSAIVAHMDGRMELIHWGQGRDNSASADSVPVDRSAVGEMQNPSAKRREITAA